MIEETKAEVARMTELYQALHDHLYVLVETNTDEETKERIILAAKGFLADEGFHVS